MRVRQKWPRHADHVSATIRQNVFTNLRSIDPVGRDDRDRNLTHQFFRNPRKGTTWHRGCDGWNARFVPPNASIQNVCTSSLYCLSKRNNLVPRGALGNQINHAKAVNYDKLGAYCFTDTAQDFNRQSHTVFIGSTPTIGTLVGMRDKKLVQEISFRPHHLNTIISCILGTRCGRDHIADLLLNPIFI